MSDATEQPSPVTTTEPRAPRSGGSVLAILGALVALPLLAIVLVLLLRDSGSDGAADAAVSGVRSARIQTVELTNGRVLFGRLEASDGDWLRLRDAYFLRRSTDTASASASKSKSGTELVPIAAEQGGDGDVLINASELVSFQNLAKGSDIGGQIEDATR
ncbi:MAG: hypothetical protein JWM98_2574 [Thermoleophilia bacterium]|nr:hypothetical protein [Thermoleophilia bacterium]